MPLTKEQILPLLTVRPMKESKNNWGYTCQHCKKKYNRVPHGEYVLINTYELERKYSLRLSYITDASMFCSINCASEAIKNINIQTMLEDEQNIITILEED